MTNPAPYPITNPTLVDAALADLNGRLTMAGVLPWLTTAYGQAKRLVKEKDGQEYRYPGIYVGSAEKGDYLDLLPDEHLATDGGFSFWDVSEPVRTTEWRIDPKGVTFSAGLVVWFDFQKVYPADWQNRTVWHVVQDVMNALNAGGATQIGDDVTFAYSGETIYPRYSHNEIKRQFLMKPYGGFRINCSIFFNEPCG